MNVHPVTDHFLRGVFPRFTVEEFYETDVTEETQGAGAVHARHAASKRVQFSLTEKPSVKARGGPITPIRAC